MANFTTRFAPSPTGLLHLGHAYSAITAWQVAQETGGRFILRIEDIDQTRCRPEYEDAIFEDLEWLGLEWEAPVRRQSDHMGDYKKALDKLRALNVVYRCFKTRKEIAEEIASAPHLSTNGPEGPQYIGETLSAMEERALMDEGKEFAWRLSIEKAKEILGDAYDCLFFVEEGAGPNAETGKIKAAPEIFGDPILARKDTSTSYHLACIHDDALQGVTHIVRGTDLFHSSHLHVLIQKLLGLLTPVYRHHPLITDESGKRFAKRDKSVTLRAMRESGAAPADIYGRLGLQS